MEEWLVKTRFVNALPMPRGSFFLPQVLAGEQFRLQEFFPEAVIGILAKQFSHFATGPVTPGDRRAGIPIAPARVPTGVFLKRRELTPLVELASQRSAS